AGGGFADLLDGGQQQPDKHGDDGDDDEQFQQREAVSAAHGRSLPGFWSGVGEDGSLASRASVLPGRSRLRLGVEARLRTTLGSDASMADLASFRPGPLEDHLEVTGPAGAGRGRGEDFDQAPALPGVFLDDAVVVSLRLLRG